MRALLFLLLAGLPVLVTGCQSAARAAGPSDEALVAVQCALGVDRLGAGAPGVSLQGARERAGTSTPVELSAWPGSAFQLVVGEGNARSVRGFDGAEAWATDTRGVTRKQELGGGEFLMLEGWARTQQWLGELARRRWSARPDPDTPDALRLVHRTSGVQVTVTLDPVSRRPARFSWQRLGRRRAIALEDWSQQGGLWLPMTVTETVDGEVVLVDRFDRRSRPRRAVARRPASRPQDVAFQGAGGVLPRSNVRFDRGGRAYVSANVDGKRDAWMLLDTGFGSHVISKAGAARLSLRPLSSVALHGVSGTARTARLQGESLRLGALTQRAPTFVELDTAFLSERAGFIVDGVLGAPLFDRTVVVIDDLRGQVEVHDPDRFDAPGLPWQPVRFDGTAPCVPGQVRANGADTPLLWFRLDTGSDDTLTVSRWAVRAHGLAGDRAGLAPRRLAGPFGEVRGWRTSASVVLLAGANMGRQVITLLRDDLPGPLSDPWIAGNVGTRLLRGQRTVLDLRSGRVAVVAEDADRSG